MRFIHILYIFLFIAWTGYSEDKFRLSGPDFLSVLPESNGEDVFLGWVQVKGGRYDLIMGAFIPVYENVERTKISVFSKLGSINVDTLRDDSARGVYLYKILAKSPDGKILIDNSVLFKSVDAADPLIVSKTSRERVLVIDGDELTASEATLVFLYKYKKIREK
jgi:hypothetical protein